MLNVCYSTDEHVKSLQTQAYILFVDFLDMCAGMLWDLVRVMLEGIIKEHMYFNLFLLFSLGELMFAAGCSSFLYRC